MWKGRNKEVNNRVKERRGKEQRIVWKGGNKEVNNRGKLRREERRVKKRKALKEKRTDERQKE